MNHMRVAFIGISVVVLAFSGKSGADQGVGPRLRFLNVQNDLMDLGDLAPAEKKVLDLEFENNGDAELVISKISTSCGCVLAELKERKYPPGTIGHIKAEFSFQGSPGESVQKEIILQTNQQEHPTAVVVIAARGTRNLTISPAKANYGQVRTGVAVDREFLVSGAIGNKEFEVLGASLETEDLAEISLEPSAPKSATAYADFYDKLHGESGSRICKLNLRLKPLKEGRWDTYLILKTNAPEAPQLRIPLSMNVVSRVYASPPVVAIVLDGNDGQTRQIELEGTEPFALRAIDFSDACLSCRPVTEGERTSHLLSVTVNSNTDGIDKKEVRINVTAADASGTVNVLVPVTLINIAKK